MFDNFNVNLRKNKGFVTYIPYIPIPEYGQSNAPLKLTILTSGFGTPPFTVTSILISANPSYTRM